MEKYSFIYREEDLEELICESEEKLLVIKSGSNLSKYLNDKDNSGLTIKIGEESYAYDECFTVCVNVRNIGKFHFIFKNKDFDLEQLKEDLIPLRDGEEPKNLAEKREKLSKMIDVLVKYSPIFAYVPEYCSILYKESLNINFPMVITEEDPDQKQVNIAVDLGVAKEVKPKEPKPEKVKAPKEPKAPREKKERKPIKIDWKAIGAQFKDIDNWLAFFSACLMVVSGAFSLNLFEDSNGLGTVFLILLLAYLGFDTYIIYLRQKSLDEPKIVGKEFLPIYMFSLVGLGAGVGVYALLGTFVRKVEEVAKLWKYIGIGAGISVGLIAVAIVLGWLLKAKIIKQKQ